ncbi:AAA family ATPase [Burkholderia sp. LMG 32019]|uniref:AAA family ATPase n=1 Tax=Burkholderia sp. LMG 32019 TaxID=3158173 RepID=UPI003C2E5AB8
MKETLFEEANGKCVYCEQRLTGLSAMHIDHYRPLGGAVDSRGKRSEDHYYWLAYDWGNLYAACPECNFSKGAKFPVVSDRTPVGITSDLDSIERPLILNPAHCVPEKHLLLDPDGLLRPKTLEGETTIEILKLNRVDLVERRARAATLLLSLPDPRLPEYLTDDVAEFCGTLRQLLKVSRGIHIDVAPETAGDPSPTPEEGVGASVSAIESSDAELEDAKYYASFPLISSISIKGLFGLSSLKINVPAGRADRPPCLALLGENGVGKSSILKALTVALYDGDAMQALGLKVNELLSDGTDSGHIHVVFDTQAVRSVTIRRDGSLERNEDATPILMLAYGATRLLPTAAHRNFVESTMSRVRNLFDPFVPLRHPSAILTTFTPEQFDFAAATIKSLLDLPVNCYLVRVDSEDSPIMFERSGVQYPLDHLSQGYKSILALACDVMATLFERWESMDAAQGVVLIDEVENHLHPTWKMRVVAGLRAAFPRVQFVVSTHDPLCLRGFEEGEVVLLKRTNADDTTIEAVQDLPAVSDMRIDQILTSRHFGLQSTIDPETWATLEEYYSLLERENSLSDEARIRLQVLDGEVKKLELPALLDRDRVMYAAIDRFLARHDRPLPYHSDEFDEDLVEFIDKLIDSQ